MNNTINHSAFKCLDIMLRYYGIAEKLKDTDINELYETTANKYGFRYIETNLLNIIISKIEFPFILRNGDISYLLIKKINTRKVIFTNPNQGNEDQKISYREFERQFINNGQDVVLYLFQPSPKSYGEKLHSEKRLSSFSYYRVYLKPFKKYLFQIFLGILIAMLLQVIPPFLTQVLVDKAVSFKDVNLMHLIILGMLVIIFGQFAQRVIQDWINFYIGKRLNITSVSDFFNRVLNHPISFFEGRSIGDIIQRIGDHKRIENFFIKSLITFIFSTSSIIIYGFIIWFFSPRIFIVFLIGNIIYVLWILFFIKMRREIDANMFKQNALNNSLQVQFIQSIHEIKLLGYEQEKRWEWERNQIALLKTSEKMFKIEQIQTKGGMFINELKNLIILFLCANAVISDELSLGMLLSMNYISSQVNGSVIQIVQFIQDVQFAIISLNRIAQISDSNSEYNGTDGGIQYLPDNNNIKFKNVYFSYNGKKGANVILRNINTKLPAGKTTAIIGESGSGKSTLLKLIIKFYSCSSGQIEVGDININDFDIKFLRKSCGVIFQDSVLFNDSIINNIVCGRDIDYERFLTALELANIKDDLELMPQRYNTMIGPEGLKLSHGQKQRILIARIIYRNPEIILLDEATSALDMKNEELVLNNVIDYFKNKTIIIVTHRLNTISQIDNVVVMEKGQVVESGDPEYLFTKEEHFYNLMKKLK